jgi:molybdopterin-binding protein
MAVAQFRIAEAAALLGVSDDTIRRWADAGRIELSKNDQGRAVVDGVELARLAQESAAESALATSFPNRKASARNKLTGVVTKVTRDGVMAQVELQAGAFRIVSLMSREAADELDLEPGSLATASIKATNVTIETLE